MLAGGLLLLCPVAANAATLHAPLVIAGIPVIAPVLHGIGGIFSSITSAVFGAFTWTISLAANFLLTTVAALVHMLIPQSWVHKGLQIMQWIVAVPDYAGKIATPGGGHQYGFAGVNDLRSVFGWLGIAIAPLTLVYATSRAMIEESDPVALPLLRMLAVGAVIVSYPYWWDQAAALVDQITNVILSLPAVTGGLYKLMEYAVDGVALGGWQLIDLGLMGAIALELLGLIFMKVVVILLGALLYATGPLMIGLVPTRQGGALARAWLTAVIALLSLGIAWATLFAVGAVMINDAGTAGPLLAGNSAFGSLIGGVLLAVAGLASLWLCLKVAREAASLLRMQLGGLLVLGGRGASSPSSGVASRVSQTTGQSLRDYGRRLAAAGSAAGGELAAAAGGAGPVGGAVAGGGRAVGQLGRRGLLGTAALAGRSAASAAAPAAAATFSRSRAGAVAVRMGRAGTASWQQAASQQRAAAARQIATPPSAGAPAGGRSGAGAKRGRPGARRAQQPAAGTPSNHATSTEQGTAPGAGGRRTAGRSRPGGAGTTRTASTSPTPSQPPPRSAPGHASNNQPAGTDSSQPEVRPSTPIGASPPPAPAASARRFGRSARSTPAPSSAASPPASAGTPPAVKQPRRTLGGRFSRPFANRKAGE
jgi:hypothetical protein